MAIIYVVAAPTKFNFITVAAMAPTIAEIAAHNEAPL
jgi:hypothetical protein